MEETRKYKQTELGLLPEDWEVAKLGDVAKVKRGVRVVKSQLKEEGCFPVFQNTYIPLGYYYKSNVKAYTPFVIIGGSAGQIGISKVDYWAADDCVYLECGNTLVNLFLYYTLLSNQKTINGYVRNGTVPRLDRRLLEKIYIPFPPIEEQRRIASALTCIDNLVDSLDRLIAKKRDIKQGAMQQLLSGKKRLKGFTEPWMEKKLGDIIDIKRGVRVVREELTEDGLFPVFQNTNKPLGYFNRNNVKAGTPYVIIGGSAGQIGICERDYWAADDCAYFDCGDTISNKFLYFLLLFHEREIQSNVRSASVPRLDRKTLVDLFVYFPSLPEQQAIASVLTSMDNELSALEAKRKKYEQIKQGMMQQLLTGRIRLENTSTLLSANTL